ncbi:unnamed protein product [Angiostrongylus costaricensis]|uniref:leucine--tRNA ligase n=1 Tax=Angiostrongylus costaricensis TaxID=334426 RepID=A0A158PLU2_ANGCS|nr:unnamed protein product [Angiostrongylus costaricensis]
MFPYPSGSLHMGHMRVYTISDATARYFRLNGFDVIHPIGWDAFGLPAENAARERGVDPRQWTVSNIESMKNQLLQTGIIFDWDRELSTCDPSFYRWTQWIFLRLHDRGLVKRNLAEVHWDPVDNTVLAAEQIDADGRSWRSGAIAEKRKLRQWMVETPRYAKRLSDGLRQLSGWHEVAEIQSNWIGKCDVYRFLFPLRVRHQPMEEILDLRVEDPISVARAAFIVIRKGHPLSDHNPTSHLFHPDRLGLSVLNGITGVWMPVIVVPDNYDGPAMNLDSGNYGGYVTSRTLQDWVVSRQRSWGTPIPMILSADGKTAVPLSDDELPLIQRQSAEGHTRYFLRLFLNEHAPLSLEAATKMPVDIYVGGIEHGSSFLRLYSIIQFSFVGFFPKALFIYTCELEPFSNLIPQGIVRGKTYVDKQGRYFSKSEIIVKGIDPLDVLSKNGVDITRLQLIDSAAPRQPVNWEESDDKGLRKWIDRVAWIVSAYNVPLNTELEEKLRESYNFFVRNVSMCLEVLNLHNTALARLQGLTNSLRKLDTSVLGSSLEAERSIYALVTMMQVFVPYTASELWAALQSTVSPPFFVDEMSWPQVDPDCSIDFMILVDGIGCGRMPVPRKEIEHLPLEKLLDRAKTQEHRNFFEKMTEKNFVFQSVTVTKRNGKWFVQPSIYSYLSIFCCFEKKKRTFVSSSIIGSYVGKYPDCSFMLVAVK